MSPAEKPLDAERIACEICLKEVPLSEATVPEGTDYFVHFCGLDCFQAWQRQQDKPAAEMADPAA
jgi:hypothetical protein